MPAACADIRKISLAALDRIQTDGKLRLRMFAMGGFREVVASGYLLALPKCPDGGQLDIPESAPYRPLLPVRITRSKHP